MGRRAGAHLLDTTGLDRHAHTRSSAGEASGDFVEERARVRARPELRHCPQLSQARSVRAGLEGGVGRDLLEHVQSADWSPDGTQLAVSRKVDGKVRLEYPIGKKIYETETPISDVRISRDGAWIAFFERVRERRRSGAVGHPSFRRLPTRAVQGLVYRRGAGLVRGRP